MKYAGQGKFEWIVVREGRVTKLLTTKQAVDAYTHFNRLNYQRVELNNASEYLDGLPKRK